MQIETTTNGGQHGRCRYKRQTEASLWHGQFEFTARNRKRKRKGSTTKTEKEQGQEKTNNSNRSMKARTRNSTDQQSQRFDSVVEHFLASDEHSPIEAWDSLVPTTPHYSMQKINGQPIQSFHSLTEGQFHLLSLVEHRDSSSRLRCFSFVSPNTHRLCYRFRVLWVDLDATKKSPAVVYSVGSVSSVELYWLVWSTMDYGFSLVERVPVMVGARVIVVGWTFCSVNLGSDWPNVLELVEYVCEIAWRNHRPMTPKHWEGYPKREREESRSQGARTTDHVDRLWRDELVCHVCFAEATEEPWKEVEGLTTARISRAEIEGSVRYGPIRWERIQCLPDRSLHHLHHPHPNYPSCGRSRSGKNRWVHFAVVVVVVAAAVFVRIQQDIWITIVDDHRWYSPRSMIGHVRHPDGWFVPFDQLYQPRNEVVGRSKGEEKWWSSMEISLSLTKENNKKTVRRRAKERVIECTCHQSTNWSLSENAERNWHTLIEHSNGDVTLKRDVFEWLGEGNLPISLSVLDHSS